MGKDEDRVTAFERRFTEAVIQDLLDRAGYGGRHGGRSASGTPAPKARAKGVEVVEGPLSWQEALRRFQEHFLEQTLMECDWNIVEVARRLKVARSHVYGLIRAHGLQREPMPPQRGRSSASGAGS